MFALLHSGYRALCSGLARKGYAAECPNVGKLLANLKFTQEMEPPIMDDVLNRKVANDTQELDQGQPAGARWLAGGRENR